MFFKKPFLGKGKSERFLQRKLNEKWYEDSLLLTKIHKPSTVKSRLYFA